MPRTPGLSPIALVRVVVALLLASHGVVRLFSGRVGPFADFLSELGIPFALAIAWGFTLFEIVGGALLALRLAVVPLATAFIVEVMAGIALVDSSQGWFVLGGGRRGGVEFSALLMACLAAILLTEQQRGRRYRR